MQYFNQAQMIAAGRHALKPTLLITMAGTLLIAVVIYGAFSMLSVPGGGWAIFLRLVGGVGCLLWTLFGLTALAHQLYQGMQGKAIPDTFSAMRFSWSRIQSLLLLPAWVAGGLLSLLLGEMLLLVLAKIPGLGLLWLPLIGVPLLILNTLVAVTLLLALFNIAARIAISTPDTLVLKDTLWHLVRQRLPELLIYNLGGVMVTLFAAALVLSPIWMGAQVTWSLMHYVVGTEVATVQAASGFWGSLAHLIGLVMFGTLFAIIASVPGVVITHMTLLVHKELDEPTTETEHTPEAPKNIQETPATKPIKKKPRRKPRARKPAAKKEATPVSTPETDTPPDEQD